MRSPIVSVIIPAYNYAHFISASLDSLLDQTYQSWECIIIDDGSKDETALVAKNYIERDPRFKYIYQHNQGLPSARNTGIRASIGQYLQFLDADDLIEKRKLELQAGYLEQNTDVDIVYSGAQYFHTEESNGAIVFIPGEEIKWMPVIESSETNALLALIRRPFVVHSALVRRSVFDRVGLFKEDLKACEDWQLWIRCAAQGIQIRFENLSVAKAFYRLHSASMIADSTLMRPGTRRLREEIGKIVADRSALHLNQRLLAEYEGYEGIYDISRGRLLSGMRQCLKAGMMYENINEKIKWWYCGLIAPLAPKKDFEQIVTSPISHSIKTILRYQMQRVFSN